MQYIGGSDRSDDICDLTVSNCVMRFEPHIVNCVYVCKIMDKYSYKLHSVIII